MPGTGRQPSTSTSSGHGDEFRRLVRNEDAVGHRDTRSSRDVGHSRTPGHSTSAIEVEDPDAASPDRDDREEGESEGQTDTAQFSSIAALVIESRQSHRQWSNTTGNSKAEDRNGGVERSHEPHESVSGTSRGANGADDAGLLVGNQSDAAITRQNNVSSPTAVNATMASGSAQAHAMDGSDAPSSSNPLAPEHVRGLFGAQQVSAQGNMRRPNDSTIGPAGLAAARQALLEASGGADASLEARLNGPLPNSRGNDDVAGLPTDEESGPTPGSKGDRPDNPRAGAALSAEITLAAAKYGVKTAERNAAQAEPAAVILPRAELLAQERPASILTPAGTVASAMASEPSWRPATVAAMSQTLSHVSPTGPATLQVQLTPHDLGVVTARLILSGGQLEVEIEASSPAAHEHLKGEEHVIEKAIRSLGYEVSQVRVTQSIVVSPLVSKDDSALPGSATPTRDQTSGNAMSSGSEGRSNGHHGGRNEGERSGGFGDRAPRDADRNHRGIYI
jgi:chemotaxis protein MotD